MMNGALLRPAHFKIEAAMRASVGYRIFDASAVAVTMVSGELLVKIANKRRSATHAVLNYRSAQVAALNADLPKPSLDRLMGGR